MDIPYLTPGDKVEDPPIITIRSAAIASNSDHKEFYTKINNSVNRSNICIEPGTISGRCLPLPPPPPTPVARGATSTLDVPRG